MKAFRTVRGQFLLLTLMLGVALLVGNGMVFYNNQRLVGIADSVDGRSLPLLNAAHEMKLAVVQVQQFLTDISATRGRDGLDDGFDEAEANAKRFHREIAKIDALAPELKVRQSGIEKAFEDYYAVGRRMAQAYVDGGPEAGNRMMGDFDATAEKLAGQVDKLLGEIQRRASLMAGGQRRLAHTTSGALLVVSLLILALLAVFYAVFRRRLQRLLDMAPVVEGMGEGDLTQVLQDGGEDEFGRFAQALDQMRVRLSEIVADIGASSRVLVDGTGRLRDSVALAGDNAGRQQEATLQLATTMEQMASSATEVASRVAEVANAGQKAQDESRVGQQSLSGAIGRLGDLVGQIDGTREVIQLLEQQSSAITGILDVIRGIAEQTNLLALNAAIEAARAGEQGRGFAVVADEVRTLASRTQTSTEEIQQMIEKLVGGVNQAVNAMQASADLAGDTMQEATGAESAFEHIVSLIEHVSQMSTHIASAAEEQSAVAREVSDEVRAMRDRAETTAQRMRDAGSVVAQMDERVRHLDGLVRHFKA